MRFGIQLETYAVPEWSDKYLRYKYLKKWLKKKKHDLASPHRARNASAVGAIWKKFSSRGSTGGHEDDAVVDYHSKALMDFTRLLEQEIVKIEDHFFFETGFLEDRLEGVENELASAEFEAANSKKNKGSGQTSLRNKAADAHRVRLQKAIVAIWACFDKLDGFVQLNSMAVYKILKKRDKLLDVDLMKYELPAYRQRLAELTMDQATKDLLNNLYHRTSDRADRDMMQSSPLDIQALSAAVNKHFIAQRSVGYTWISFFLGFCTVLVLDLLVLLSLNPTNSSYSLEALLAIFPLYRFFLLLNLLLWGLAGAVAVFEHFGVNYKFLLDVDPRVEVNSSHLAYLASLQFAFWLFGFGLFLADFKFGILGAHNQYWVYAVLQIACQFSALFLHPTRDDGYRKKRRAVAAVIGKTLMCGIWIPATLQLSLTINIVGDYLTSMAKPLGDIEYMLCYYSHGLFNDHVVSCPIADPIMQPIFTIFPFWLRLMQCSARYRQEPDKKKARVHLGNICKYAASINVILITVYPWNSGNLSIYVIRLIWVGAYIVASIYSLCWDFMFDWGLLPDPDSFLRSDDQIMYPQWMYYMFSLFNFFARLTWAVTLMPLRLVEDQLLTATLMNLTVAILEILRRNAWVVMRLENEHLTNSSRYRAMLWVPKLHNYHSQALHPHGFAAEDIVNERAATEETWVRVALKNFGDFAKVLQDTVTGTSGAVTATPSHGSSRGQPPRSRAARPRPPPRSSGNAVATPGVGLATLAAIAKMKIHASQARQKREKLQASQFQKPPSTDKMASLASMKSVLGKNQKNEKRPKWNEAGRPTPRELSAVLGDVTTGSTLPAKRLSKINWDSLLAEFERSDSTSRVIGISPDGQQENSVKGTTGLLPDAGVCKKVTEEKLLGLSRDSSENEDSTMISRAESMMNNNEEEMRVSDSGDDHDNDCDGVPVIRVVKAKTCEVK